MVHTAQREVRILSIIDQSSTGSNMITAVRLADDVAAVRPIVIHRNKNHVTACPWEPYLRRAKQCWMNLTCIRLLYIQCAKEKQKRTRYPFVSKAGNVGVSLAHPEC